MNQRRATILAVACLGLFYDFLVFTLPPILVLIGLLPTVAILGTLTLRELHVSLRKQRELMEAKRTREQ